MPKVKSQGTDTKKTCLPRVKSPSFPARASGDLKISQKFLGQFRTCAREYDRASGWAVHGGTVWPEPAVSPRGVMLAMPWNRTPFQSVRTFSGGRLIRANRPKTVLIRRCKHSGLPIVCCCSIFCTELMSSNIPSNVVLRAKTTAFRVHVPISAFRTLRAQTLHRVSFDLFGHPCHVSPFSNSSYT